MNFSSYFYPKKRDEIMSIATFSIKQPIVIISIVILILICGLLGIDRLGVDMYPDVDLPFIVVTTTYPGAGPEEIEEQISKKIEDEISCISGLKTVQSNNLEGISIIFSEFDFGSDIEFCEQQIRDKISKIRNDLPNDIDEPTVARWDIAKDPVVIIALTADLPDVDLYDLANEKIKPMIEQVPDVGSVVISGGTRREIQVELDRDKLNEYRIPASSVVDKLSQNGINVPAGRDEKGHEEKTVRSVGRYQNISEIENSVIFFSGDPNNSITVKSLGSVRDGAEDRTTLGYIFNSRDNKTDVGKITHGSLIEISDGNEQAVEQTDNFSRPALFISAYKQSGTNTVKVVDNVFGRLEKISTLIKDYPGKPQLVPIHDSAKFIRVNIEDVEISIVTGILLAMIIVYLFLGNIRSTFITGIAIPISLLGGFVLMYIMGFSINIMTLLALSLSVGLLIDDAIVVRENIFRKIEENMVPDKAAEMGTKEVMMAVIATTVTIIAVFFPIAFMQGHVGRFFKQFALTIVFVLIVSLFDSLTVAPMLSAYFSEKRGKRPAFLPFYFEKFQRFLERVYVSVMNVALAHPGRIVLTASIMFILSLGSVAFIKTTFMQPPDDKEFKLSIELPSGTSLDGTREAAGKIEQVLRNISGIEKYAFIVGNSDKESNVAEFYITLVPERDRDFSNAEIKQHLRSVLIRDYISYKPVISEYTIGDPYPFAVNIEGNNLDEMEKYSRDLITKLKEFPELTDVQTAFETGKPEYQVVLDKDMMANLGINSGMAGNELRYHIAGETVGKLYDRGYEYDIRVRLKKDQRDIRKGYESTRIPNINGMMVPLSIISKLTERHIPSQIIRENRKRIIQITANIATGQALGPAMERLDSIVKNELKVPDGMSVRLTGDAENVEELMSDITMAIILSLIIIYLILSSLYGSFITPFTILIAILPALTGAFIALAVTGQTLDMYSMIGIVMLMGIVTKNSILLVDYAVKYVREGMERKEAIFNAGKLRLRPILMTSFAMLAGTTPVALGIGEAAKGRMSMGIAIIGGIIFSTLLTLVVVPAIYSYVDTFRNYAEKPFSLETMRRKNLRENINQD